MIKHFILITFVAIPLWVFGLTVNFGGAYFMSVDLDVVSAGDEAGRPIVSQTYQLRTVSTVVAAWDARVLRLTPDGQEQPVMGCETQRRWSRIHGAYMMPVSSYPGPAGRYIAPVNEWAGAPECRLTIGKYVLEAVWRYRLVGLPMRVIARSEPFVVPPTITTQ